MSNENSAPKVATPYLNARREWDERYGDSIARARTWQVVAIGAMAVAAMAVAGVAYIGAQSKIQPFVIGIDGLGSPVAVAKPIAAGQEINQRIMISQVANWVWNARTMLADPDAQKILVDRVYAMINADTGKYLNDYYAAHPPFSTDGTTVKVTITSVLPTSAATFEVSWTESRAEPGRMAVTTRWKASITTGSDPKMAEKPTVALNNPLGIFVKSLTWAEAITQ
jgi:type IV secretion system protein VirB5